MTTHTGTSERTTASGPVPEPVGAGAPRPSSTVWLRRSVVALGVVTAVTAVTGVFLTFRYRPAPRLDGPSADTRSGLVAAAQALHAAGAYAFVALVCVVVGIALVIANRRHRASGVILASGFGLFLVSIGFLATGLQLPWEGFAWVGANPAATFDGVFGFPREVVTIFVGNGEVNPSRYETVAWIHIAGLPVFAVFAAWWLLGSIQADRPAAGAPDRDQSAQGDPTRLGATLPAAAPPARSVGLAEQLFGTDDPGTVHLQVDAFLGRHLGTGIAALDFTRIGSGIILGVTLGDGRPAVVRLYPPATDAAHLHSVQDVQLHLVAQGFPAPRPLLGPTPFGVGLATVEGRLFEPPSTAGDDRSARRALAEGLACFVRYAATLSHHADLAGRGPLGPPAPGSVFPEPVGTPFDFAATTGGAEWIEELGGRARVVLDAAPPSDPVVGHFGWRVENVAITQGHLVGVFDWAQVGSATEAVVLGSAAHQFTIDGRAAHPRVPTPEEVREFVADYEGARGRALTPPERVEAKAAYVYFTAYGARCEHVLAVRGHAAPGRFRERLAATGAALLG